MYNTQLLFCSALGICQQAVKNRELRSRNVIREIKLLFILCFSTGCDQIFYSVPAHGIKSIGLSNTRLTVLAC